MVPCASNRRGGKAVAKVKKPSVITPLGFFISGLNKNPMGRIGLALPGALFKPFARFAFLSGLGFRCYAGLALGFRVDQRALLFSRFLVGKQFKGGIDRRRFE